MSMDEKVNKPKRAFGRSLTDFENLSEAEKKLIDCAARGEMCVLGESVPAAPTIENLVRPELIRFLALGGDEDAPVHEKGVQLKGAWIGAGPDEDPRELDFDGARLTTRLALWSCNFPSRLTFRDARAISLSFEGSVFHGMFADRLKLDGGLFLRRVHSKGTVRLLGAEIGGNLDCTGGGFQGGPSRNNNQAAIACDGAKIGGNVFLDEYVHLTTAPRCSFHAIGEVRLRGVTISHDLSCVGAGFDNPRGKALICDGARVGGGLFFRNGLSAKGIISFAHASAGTLADDLTCWPDQSLDLEGFRYERIDSLSSLDSDGRIAWLKKQVSQRLAGRNFALQPWMHLAKVLREQGHFREAAEVDIAREERLRAAGKIANPQWARFDNQGNYVTFVSSLDDYFSYFFHWLYGVVSGYGHKPRRIFYSAALLWLFCALVFHLSADTASFTLSNPAAARILRDDCDKKFASQNLDLMRCAEQLKTYPRFSPWAYSFDLILPVVRLGQSTTWAPTWDAVWTQRLVWFEEIFGWVAALTLAAIAAGLVKRKDG
jgi:hypothetical protein